MVSEDDECNEKDSTTLKKGDKATRDHLLDLLDKRLTKKRTRLSEKTSAIKKKTKNPAKKAALNSKSPANTSQKAKDDQLGRPSNNPSSKFTCFSDSQPVDMIRQVGPDMSNSDRECLIRNCRIYEDLICLPPNPPTGITASKSATSDQVHLPHAEFTFCNMEDKNRSVTGRPHSSSTSTPPITASTSILPSLEHGTLTFPRPRPTILHSHSPPHEVEMARKKQHQIGNGVLKSKTMIAELRIIICILQLCHVAPIQVQFLKSLQQLNKLKESQHLLPQQLFKRI